MILMAWGYKKFMLYFLIGFIAGCIATLLGMVGWVAAEFYKAQQQAHEEGYENPYL